MTEKIIDQTPMAESISEKIHLEFLDHLLVKPLDPIKVTKEFNQPTGDVTEDKNGIKATENVEKETKEVDSDYRRGIVLKIPTGYGHNNNSEYKIKVGDVIVFPERCGRCFDLLKDSRLVRLYDVIAIEK